MDSQIIYDTFRAHFGEKPALLVRSPGRINLIGEHVDYNDGFVLPGAIDKGLVLALAPAAAATGKLMAVDQNRTFEFDPKTIQKAKRAWPNYFLGVLHALTERDLDIPAVNCVFGGDLPIGAGLSSSAALACGFAFALKELFELNLSRRDLVEIGHRCENQFVGVQCGIMDQFANIFGEKNRVLKLDCRTLEYESLTFDFPDVRLLLLDTQVSHDLAVSEYNLRRRQCELGVAEIRRVDAGVHSLRDVSVDALQQVQAHLDPVIFKRCHYVVEEMARVQQACGHLRRAELPEFGRLMFATHAGLRDDYEVSCPQLDFLVEIAENHPDVLGARLMGAGFGGCTLNLVMKEAMSELLPLVQRAYRARFGADLQWHVVRIANGTAVVGSSA